MSQVMFSSVSVPYPLYQSEKGRYFIGQTEMIPENTSKVLAAHTNPYDSKVNLYVNVITITNTSESDVSTEFYVRTILTQGNPSENVSATNVSIVPAPKPAGKIIYQCNTNKPIEKGIGIFSRIISGRSTQVVDGGQIILPPGQSLLTLTGGYLPVTVKNSIIVAFGWWEEPIFGDYEYPYC